MHVFSTYNNYLQRTIKDPEMQFELEGKRTLIFQLIFYVYYFYWSFYFLTRCLFLI